MSHHPGRIVAGFALLLGVWVVTYWLWTPANRRISFADAPRLMQDEPRAVNPNTVTPLVVPEPLAPAPVPAGPRLVQRMEPPKFREYTVQKGDTSFEAVSKRFFGETRWASAIARANPLVSPDKLRVGKTHLKIPIDPTNIQGKMVWVREDGTPAEPPRDAQNADGGKPPAPLPGPGSSWPSSELTHVVKSGESLSTIAKQYYSAPAGYLKIYEANRDQLSSPDKLKVGMTLRIPPGP